MKKAFLLIGVLALALGITYLVLRKSDSGGNKPRTRDAAAGDQFENISI